MRLGPPYPHKAALLGRATIVPRTKGVINTTESSSLNHDSLPGVRKRVSPANTRPSVELCFQDLARSDRSRGYCR